MYGIVLMAALTTTSTAPSWCHGGLGSCHGGWGSCHGGYASGWNGWGCYGMCYGSSYGGCYGGCSGPYSGYSCWTAYGACYGGWYQSPYSAWGCSAGYAGCTGCYGCYGGYSGYGLPLPGGTTFVSPGMTNPVAPGGMPSMTPPVGPGPGAQPPEVTPPPKVNKEEARAKVRIDLPVDAKLYVDGKLMKTESAVRMFHTPDLAVGQTYFYDLKAVLVRNGQSLEESRQIIVRPGETTTASFAGLEQRAAALSLATQTATTKP